MHKHRLITAAIAFVFLFIFASCSVLREIGGTLTNLSNCRFKIQNVSDFALAGVSLSGKQKFSVSDGLALLPAFTQHRIPASFTLNVAAVNPNNGSGGTKATSATLRGFAWTLLIDSVQTISGDIAKPVTIPGVGEQTIIPLRMELDLYSFFGKRGYDGLLNLALSLGGVNRSTSHIQLRAKPTVDTPLGPISPPNEITIVDTEFRGG